MYLYAYVAFGEFFAVLFGLKLGWQKLVASLLRAFQLLVGDRIFPRCHTEHSGNRAPLATVSDKEASDRISRAAANLSLLQECARGLSCWCRHFCIFLRLLLSADATWLLSRMGSFNCGCFRSWSYNLKLCVHLFGQDPYKGTPSWNDSQGIRSLHCLIQLAVRSVIGKPAAG